MPDTEMNDQLVETIRTSDCPHETFSLLAELAVNCLRSSLEVADDGLVDLTDPESVDNWLTTEGCDRIQPVCEAFSPEAHLRALEGEIANRPHEVLGSGDYSVTEAVQFELEIAVRNEAAYRLQDRGVIPEGSWREDRYGGE